jgi:DNA polymerase I-like protein with 3'-5' exonuclease and polymerase domains
MDRSDAYDLLHRGAVALAEVEANGMRIDVDYLDKAIATTATRIRNLEGNLRGCEEYRLQRRRYGQATNLGSRSQLAAVLFEDLGHEPLTTTTTGRPQLDEVMLEKIGTKYAKGFLRLEKLYKLHGTYLLGVRREVEGGFLHTFFGLHLVRSYRGQSDSPNLQNIPIRDPVQGKIIRQAFIPRKSHAIVEIDYSGIEVRVACALSADPKLTYDTTEGDMHRDMAAECYMLDAADVLKPVRQNAKGGFVFAEFYGDWYKQVTKNLWDGVERYKLMTPDGRSLYDHLADHGIRSRGECDPQGEAVKGTFEYHIKAVEDRFWGKRFVVYHAKRAQWVEEYRRQGYIDIVTGFRCNGPMNKNQVMNYHIQGPAFHCLLWSLTRLVSEIRHRHMGTKVTGQIHDSIIADVPLGELDDYLALARDITTRQLLEAWDWITLPLEVEAEMATTNWYEKKKVEPHNVVVKTANCETVCVACGGTGRNSKGGLCIPCQVIKGDPDA